MKFNEVEWNQQQNLFLVNSDREWSQVKMNVTLLPYCSQECFSTCDCKQFKAQIYSTLNLKCCLSVGLFHKLSLSWITLWTTPRAQPRAILFEVVLSSSLSNIFINYTEFSYECLWLTLRGNKKRIWNKSLGLQI